ncbi:hypothetical protein GJV26_01595 [Massilia dura]|uniref:Uncharacterized protein n=1 Tax=Pseudoduganella dura TaxID=321982 RepID=A0A6I3X2W7_9BURK|nr:hypothetical protein [Pseudoduganella dura]MUI11194.1 hypothetical protein [Pseudoduganella dura]GGX94087.1 hypothetical protein GCM10007386_26340 [Pseudoduganella dura]
MIFSIAPVVGLACDLTCSTLVISVQKRGEQGVAIVGGPGKPWRSPTDERGRRFLFIHAGDAGNLIGVRNNDVVSLDLEKRTYRVLYSHDSVVFHPARSGESLLFSDSPHFDSRLKNPYQNRRLYRYDLTTKKLKRLLAPWVAYALGAPVPTVDGRHCFSMILPAIEAAHRPAGTPGPTADDPQGFCFPESAMDGATADQTVLRKAVLPGPAADFYGLSVDRNGRYAAGWTVQGGPGRWMVYDLKSRILLRSLGTHLDRVALSPDGERYAHVAGGRGRVKGTIHAITTAEVLTRFDVDLRRVETVVLTPGTD